MMNKYVTVLWIFLFAFRVAPSFASAQPVFSLVAKTATYITIPANRQSFVQYIVTNNTSSTRTLTMIPIPNVSQRSDDSSQCANPFVLGPNQSCNLTLSINGANTTSSYSGGPVVCQTKPNSNTPDLFLCSQPETSMQLWITPVAATTPLSKLYVSNWDGNSISLCYINSAGHLENCLVSAVSNTFINPEALAVSNNVLFVANIGGGMSSCAIDLITGELSNCQNATSNLDAAQIYAPDGIAINESTAYISSSGPLSAKQGMSVCTVSGQLLIGCRFTQGNAANYSIPSDIAFYNNYLYLSNFNSQNVTTSYCGSTSQYCDTSNGSVSGTSTYLNQPEGITFASINTNNYAYFTNHGDNSITLCRAPTATPPTSFTSCGVTEGYFNGFGNLVILPNPLKAFIPSGLKTIAMCDVSPTDGGLSNCVNSTELSFNNPSGLVII